MLIKSVDRFDPDRGVEFATFATTTIMGELKRHFRDKGWAVRAPCRLQELYLQMAGAVSSLSQELGRSPTIAEIAAGHGDSQRRQCSKLWRPAKGTGARRSTPPMTTESRWRADLGPRTQTLPGSRTEPSSFRRCRPSPEREPLTPLLTLRFFEGLTQSEIAAKVGQSQMHVSRVFLASSLVRLRGACSPTMKAPERKEGGSWQRNGKKAAARQNLVKAREAKSVQSGGAKASRSPGLSAADEKRLRV